MIQALCVTLQKWSRLIFRYYEVELFLLLLQVWENRLPGVRKNGVIKLNLDIIPSFKTNFKCYIQKPLFCFALIKR